MECCIIKCMAIQTARDKVMASLIQLGGHAFVSDIRRVTGLCTPEICQCLNIMLKYEQVKRDYVVTGTYRGLCGDTKAKRNLWSLT